MRSLGSVNFITLFIKYQDNVHIHIFSLIPADSDIIFTVFHIQRKTAEHASPCDRAWNRIAPFIFTFIVTVKALYDEFIYMTGLYLVFI